MGAVGEQDETPETEKHPGKGVKRRLLFVVVAVAAAVVLGVASYAGYVYAVSPAVIRSPKMEHYHFRMQVLIDGRAENFSQQKYQTGYSKDQCDANLTEQPFHFHDGKDQFVHVHWEGVTGGLLLKNYGWNYIGGTDNALGYRISGLSAKKVMAHGDELPAAPKNAQFYVYIGDEHGYQEKGFDAFKSQDLEQFFGKTSNSPAHELNKQKSSLLDSLSPKAYAHGTEDHSQAATGAEAGQERLERINNLIGNIVIFVQQDRPTDAQITERFNKLEPLSESTCSG